MGWISDRHMRSGGSIGGTKGMTFKDKPLRRIAYVINYSSDMFTPNFVRLECGHNASAWGQKRARCEKCRDGAPEDEFIFTH